MDNVKSKIPAMPLVFAIVFAIAARASGIVYSFFATDVLYSDSFFVYILPLLRQLFSAMSYASAATAAFIRIFKGRKVTSAVLAYLAIIIVDAVVVILYDFFNGALEKRLVFAILYRFALILYSMIIMLIALALAKYLLNQRKSALLSVLTAAVLPAVIDVTVVLWNCVSTLFELEFYLYTSEIVTMLTDIGIVILACVLSGAIAVFFTKKYTNLNLSKKRSA